MMKKLGIIDINQNAKTEFAYTSIQIISDTNLIQLSNSTDGNVEIMDNKATSILKMNNATVVK